MKKKKTPRELREARELERKERGKAFQKDNDKKGAVSAQDMKEFVNTHETCRLKSVGLKSVFFTGKKYVLTSFGRGNEAVIEKLLEEIKPSGDTENVTSSRQFAVESVNIKSNPAFDVKGESVHKRFQISGYKFNRLSAEADIPSVENAGENIVREDILKFKNTLEKKYFGVCCPDNIHIQIIYNILDIEKILTVYSSNAVFSLNNLDRERGGNTDFFGMGYLSARNTFLDYCNFKNKDGKSSLRKSYEKFEKLMEDKDYLARLGYFGKAFYDINTNKARRRSDQEIYDVMALVSSLRQYCVHDEEKVMKFDLYCLDGLEKEFRDILDKLYRTMVEKLNNNFLMMNKINLNILQTVCKKVNLPDDINTIANDYYDFIVRADYKNLGFSIKRLREAMLEKNAANLKNEKYDSVRFKLYKLLDFLIYFYYRHRGRSRVDTNVNCLRSQRSGDGVDTDDKEIFYRGEAEHLFKELSLAVDYIEKNIMVHVKERNSLDLNKMPSWEHLEINMISTGEDVTYFSKLMYLLTLFLDGKEINDLLTTLINKFDNISSLLSVLQNLSAQGIILNTAFCNKYIFFANSKKVCEELKIVNSFARMEKPISSAKKIMYKEAIEILGVDIDEDIDSLVDRLLNIEDGTINTNASKGMRNFIASNVIESDRFKYLIRYNNAKRTRLLAKNKKIVHFVLSKMPKEQIERCYRGCFPMEELLSLEHQINRLTDCIAGISYRQFKDVKQQAEKGSKEGKEKQKFQAVISLYLTVMYLITKNLVLINARYIIAFHCVERDLNLLSQKLSIALDNNKDKNRYLLVTEYFIKEKMFNQRALKYIENNKAMSDEVAINEYRNKIAHLNVVSSAEKYAPGIADFKSYFELYHYIAQCLIADGLRGENSIFRGTDKTREYVENVKKYNSYSKDFVKALNIPFAYSLARYKNLSIDALFDKNSPVEKKGEKQKK